jgi:glycosyltransferase involved in cell wall biosynthesis
MSGQPRVTIAIPTRNRAAWLREAVASVLSQSYEDFELLISDNCSDDCTPEVAAEFVDPRISFFRQPANLGMVGNWNFCLEQARGELFLVLSDDDVLEPEAIASLQSELCDAAVALVYSRVRYVGENSPTDAASRLSPLAESGASFIVNALANQRDVMPSATLHRTQQAKDLGGYPDIGTAADLALRLALAIRGSVRFRTEPLARYRMHGQALSNEVDGVTASLEQLARWASDPACPLYQYREQVCTYSRRVLREMAMGAALRGRKEASAIALDALRRMGAPSVWLLQCQLAGLPPVRWAATVRRTIRGAQARGPVSGQGAEARGAGPVGQ